MGTHSVKLIINVKDRLTLLQIQFYTGQNMLKQPALKINFKYERLFYTD